MILFSVGYQSMVLSLFYAGGEKKKNKQKTVWLVVSLCVYTKIDILVRCTFSLPSIFMADA